MNYDPNLRAAIDEIKEIMNKRNIGGIVILHGERQLSEYLFKIDPAYACSKIENNEFKIKGKLIHFGGDKEKQKRSITLTINMFRHFREVLKQINMWVYSANATCDTYFDSEDTDPTHTTKTATDN